MAENIDESRFELKAEAISTYMPKAAESDSELVSSDEDSIFQEDHEEKAVKFSLMDKKKGKDLQEGDLIRLQITKVIVTDENIISTVKML